jgi:hypothetical protein
MLDDQLHSSGMADVRFVPGIIQGVGQVAAKDDILA